MSYERQSSVLSTLLLALLCVPLAGCLAVGYSSGGGWFIWPGGLGLLLLVLVVLFAMRRR